MDYTYLIHTKNQHRLIRLVASLLLDHMVERQVLMVYKASTPNNMSGTWLKTELNLIENQNIICVVTLGASSRFFVDGFFFGFFWPPFLLAGLFEGLLDSSPTFKMSPKSNPCPSPPSSSSSSSPPGKASWSASGSSSSSSSSSRLVFFPFFFGFSLGIFLLVPFSTFLPLSPAPGEDSSEPEEKRGGSSWDIWEPQRGHVAMMVGWCGEIIVFWCRINIDSNILYEGRQAWN